MKYYKDAEGSVYAYEADGSQDDYIKPELVKMTDDEVNEHLCPLKALRADSRIWRDLELARADVQLMKVQDGMTEYGTQKAWREYRVALRNWPATEDFPLTRPVAPDSK